MFFPEFLPSDRKKSYTSHRLQQKLERHFGNLITIQSQQGQDMSNLIYSSTISIPETIGAAIRIQADMHSATVHDLRYVAHICDEIQILQAAAGILRRQISDITTSDDEYPAPEEVSISNYNAKLPLKTFMCWLLDDSAFESANDSTSVPIGKLRKCLSLEECIVSVSKNKFTSFHLGHHIYGSNNLIGPWGKTLSYRRC